MSESDLEFESDQRKLWPWFVAAQYASLALFHSLDPVDFFDEAFSRRLLMIVGTTGGLTLTAFALALGERSLAGVLLALLPVVAFFLAT